MGSLQFNLYSYFLVLITVTELVICGCAITHWQDTRVLKQFKNSLNPNSITPGSCLSSWDFSVDPCDSLSGEKFTCGIRCDAVSSKYSRVTELALDQAGYSGSLNSTFWNLPVSGSHGNSNSNTPLS